VTDNEENHIRETTTTDGHLETLLSIDTTGTDPRYTAARRLVHALRHATTDASEDDLAQALATVLDTATCEVVIGALRTLATWEDQRPLTDPVRRAHDLKAAARGLAHHTHDPSALPTIREVQTVISALTDTVEHLPPTLANLADWATLAHTHRQLSTTEKPRQTNLPLLVGELHRLLTRSNITTQQTAGTLVVLEALAHQLAPAPRMETP